MKKLQLLLICLFAHILFGQTKFDNEKLTIVQDIFYNTTKKNINTFMTNKGYTVGEAQKGDDGDLYTFKSQFNRVQVQYNAKGANSQIIMLYAGAVNNILIEPKIQDAGYASTEKQNLISGLNEKASLWTKKGEKYSFVTYSDDTHKIGFLCFGEFQ